MSLESVTVPQDLNVANPAAGDVLTEGDNHLRIIKVAAKQFCWEHVGTATASAAASASTYALIGTFEAGYDYHLAVEQLYYSASSQPYVRVSTGGGVTDSGTNYAVSTYASVSSAGNGSSSAAQINLQGSPGNAADETGHLEITILNPMGATNPRHIFISATSSDTTTTIDHVAGGGMYKTTTAVDGLVITSASATITCTLKLYRRWRSV